MKTVLVLLILVLAIRADLPVHCVKHTIEGKWKMFVSKSEMKGHGSLSCGHRSPDSQESSYRAGQDSFKESESFTLKLNSDYSVDDGQKSRGSWTMVYDEGFEVEYNNVKYFAFSKYAPDSKEQYKSYCGETLIGWYNNLGTGERGCYRAEKDGVKSEATDTYDMISVVQPEFIQTTTKNNGKIKIHKESTDHKKAVESLNTHVKKNWNAKAHKQFEGKTVQELNEMAGRKKHHAKKTHKTASFSQIKHSDVSDLPRSYSAEEYLVDARQQKSCGSCYAISTMEMLSARLKMMGEQVDLSPQYSLDCNYYNQGCNGGYPFLVEKFASEQYLVSEEQYPYKAEDGSCKKVDLSGSSKVFSVKDYKYIGGGYGLSNERDIMLELFQNGPVILNFEPSYDFMYYDGGVYHSVAENDWMSNKPEWEKVDHSVLCYGWGEENNEKFWLLQNSWGQSWGENGNFRMRRGVDESAIESMAEAATPVVLTKSGNTFIEMNRNINLLQNTHLRGQN